MDGRSERLAVVLTVLFLVTLSAAVFLFFGPFPPSLKGLALAAALAAGVLALLARKRLRSGVDEAVQRLSRARAARRKP